MKNSILIFTLVLLSSACATLNMKSASVSDRSKTYNITDSLKQRENHSRVGVWIAKKFNSAQKVIQYNDEPSGRYVVNGMAECEVLNKDLGYTTAPMISFSLDIQSKDNSIVVAVEDIIESNGLQRGVRPTTKAAADMVFTECISPLVNSLEASLK